MDLTTLQTECGLLLGDPGHDRFPEDTLTRRINTAQTIIEGYTKAVKTVESLTPVAGTATLTLNADTMDITRVTKTKTDNTIAPLPGISREELDYRYPQWNTWNNGEPLYWFYDATNQQLNLVPAPDSANAITNGISVWEIRKPADLADAGDLPFDDNNQMVPYHWAIVHWVVAVCFMQDGTDSSLTKSKFHMSGDMQKPGQFEFQLGRIMSEFDVPDSVPQSIQWRPQGGRLGYVYYPSKSNPFLY